MGQRLSAVELKKKYDTGFHHLPLKKSHVSSDLVVLDLPGLLSRADRSEVIPTIPAQQIYLALKSEGLEDHKDVLAYLTSEQLTRIVDYDCWPESRLDRRQAFDWLKYYRYFSPTALYSAYRGLDEEYQIALLQGLVRVYDEEEIEKLPLDVRDQLFTFPGNELFYDILSEDQSEIEFVTNLLQSCMAGHMEYAMALLQHATYDIPNEPEFQLRQFRNARLEEDGFVSPEEAHTTFLPVNIEALKSRWQHMALNSDSSDHEALTNTETPEQLFFLDRVRQSALGTWDLDTALRVHQRMVILANHICTDCGIEPSQPQEIKEIFEQSHGLISLGLEFASDGNLEKGVAILAQEQPKTLFRAGVTLVHLVRQKLIQTLEKRGFAFTSKLEKLNNAAAFGQIQWFFDTECFSTLGFELTERLKGLFNRFPMAAERQTESGRFLFTALGNLATLNELAEDIAQEINKYQMHN